MLFNTSHAVWKQPINAQVGTTMHILNNHGTESMATGQNDKTFNSLTHRASCYLPPTTTIHSINFGDSLHNELHTLTLR